MAEYIELDSAVMVADYAVDEHPYDKIPGKPETFSEYNQGWHDACDYIRNRLENLPAADVEPVRRGCKMCNADGGTTYFGAVIDLGNDGEWHKIRFCPVCGRELSYWKNRGADNGD